MLHYTPLVWKKLTYLQSKSNSEICGFCLTPSHPLRIEDFYLIPSLSSSVHFSMSDSAVADYLDDMVDHGFHPHQCLRVWLHSHPGSSKPSPSTTDNATFSSAFCTPNGPSYSIMAIICGPLISNTYARLYLRDFSLSVSLDSSIEDTPLSPTLTTLWDAELARYKLTPPPTPIPTITLPTSPQPTPKLSKRQLKKLRRRLQLENRGVSLSTLDMMESYNDPDADLDRELPQQRLSYQHTLSNYLDRFGSSADDFDDDPSAILL